jgi:hypothetical protein
MCLDEEFIKNTNNKVQVKQATTYQLENNNKAYAIKKAVLCRLADKLHEKQRTTL